MDCKERSWEANLLAGHLGCLRSFFLEVFPLNAPLAGWDVVISLLNAAAAVPAELAC